MFMVWMVTRSFTNRMCVWQTVTVDHALGCPYSGFPSLHHNEIRDVTADLLNEICHNVSMEPELQSLSSKVFTYRTGNTKDGARLEVKAPGFWGNQHQCTFFDVWVSNPLAPSNCRLSLPQCLCSHEREKRRAYDQQVRDQGGAWVLHALGVHHDGRNGEGSQSHLWADSRIDCNEEGSIL